ncbi:MAG: Ku protein [bacterium]
MASIWKGALAFGLVNIPVQLESAVRPAAKLPFRQLDKKHEKPIKLQRVSSTGDVVPWRDIVKGYETSKGRFVIVDDADFKAAAVEKSHVLEMTDFVPADSIDPRYFETPYFLTTREGGEKAYALFRDALEQTGKIGIGTLALRERQHLAAVKPMGKALVLELMRFEDELVDPDTMKLPAATKVKPQERAIAVQLIEALAGEFDPSKYKDEYHDKLRAIIKAKAKGKPLPVPEVEAREHTDVLDLVQRLKESIAANKASNTAGNTAGKKKSAKSARKRAKSA